MYVFSFEWSYGWDKKFGLYGWDHGDPKFKRTLHETSKARSLHVDLAHTVCDRLRTLH